MPDIFDFVGSGVLPVFLVIVIVVLLVSDIGSRYKVAGANEALGEVPDAVHHLLELRAFATQGLCIFGVVPDVGAFQLPVYFFETFDFAVVVKDTP